MRAALVLAALYGVACGGADQAAPSGTDAASDASGLAEAGSSLEAGRPPAEAGGSVSGADAAPWPAGGATEFCTTVCQMGASQCPAMDLATCEEQCLGDAMLVKPRCQEIWLALGRCIVALPASSFTCGVSNPIPPSTACVTERDAYVQCMNGM